MIRLANWLSDASVSALIITINLSANLTNLHFGKAALSPDCREQVEIEAKYEGYIERQTAEVKRVQRLEEWAIPHGFNYDSIRGFRIEARERLKHFLPATLGQASRIYGVTPADVAILMVHLERAKCAEGSAS